MDGTQRNSEPEWEALGALEDFPVGGLRPVRVRGRQLVVARPAPPASAPGRASGDEPPNELPDDLSGDDVQVLDNRCPHEGYPLAQGTLVGHALTCCWHNWKFDVRDGACLLGGEGVRSFPARVVDGRVEADLSDPEPSTLVPGLLESLGEALFDADLGRATRDGVRLLQLGYGPRRLLADVARYDARHAEYGTSHALAVAADCGRLLERHPGNDAMFAIAPAMDMCADTNHRLPERSVPSPEGEAGGPGEGDPAAALREAVEAEDAGRAEGLVRSAFAEGRGRKQVEAWLLPAIAAHFTDFGHQLIYLVKTRELLDGLERELRTSDGADPVSAEVDGYAADLYAALTYATVLATREDTLPYMRAYRAFLDRVEPQLAEVHGRRREDVPFDAEALRDAVLDGRAEEALEALWDAVWNGTPPARIARALVAAGAHRLLRYDGRLEFDGTVAENFVWATHRFTFPAAVRHATERFDAPEHTPDLVRLLVHAVAFVHTGRAMDVAPAARIDPRAPGGTDADPASVLAAMANKQPERAVEQASACLRGGRGAELRERLEDFVLADPVVRPIAVAHVIKTTLAAFEESEALADSPDRHVPVLAAVRTWSLPLVERRVCATVAASIGWVAEGRVPRKLTQ